jgi:hypothetical protein
MGLVWPERCWPLIAIERLGAVLGGSKPQAISLETLTLILFTPSVLSQCWR